MSDDDRIWFVQRRFDELSDWLEAQGWPVIERGDLSEWDEGRRVDPVMGVVRIRGARDLPDLGTRATFTVKEWWARPPADGPLEREGVVLAGYHYTGVTPWTTVRQCFDPVRHPGEEYHVHPDGTSELRSHGVVTVEDALAALEQRLAEELLELAGLDKLDADEDTVDDVFGESDD